jgi:hypothetical protein
VPRQFPAGRVTIAAIRCAHQTAAVTGSALRPVIGAGGTSVGPTTIGLRAAHAGGLVRQARHVAPGAIRYGPRLLGKVHIGSSHPRPAVVHARQSHNPTHWSVMSGRVPPHRPARGQKRCTSQKPALASIPDCRLSIVIVPARSVWLLGRCPRRLCRAANLRPAPPLLSRDEKRLGRRVAIIRQVSSLAARAHTVG